MSDTAWLNDLAMPTGLVVRNLRRRRDYRGWLVELFRCDELDEGHWPAMAYLSETLPGVVRGPHEHTKQSELFAFLGPGDLELHLWDRRKGSPTFGQHVRIFAEACMRVGGERRAWMRFAGRSGRTVRVW